MSDAGAAAPFGVRTLQFNPERAPALISKYQKMLGKDLEKIEVTYEPDSVTVLLFGLGSFAKIDADGDTVGMSVAEFKAKKQEAAKPSDDEALRAFRNKFEIRLGIEFPREGGPKSASDADLQAFLNGRPFNERRAMLMSNKQFRSAYPNGFAPANPPQVP